MRADAERIEALQAELVSSGIDAALIYDRENLIYFTGLPDLEGCVLCIPAQGEAELFCLAYDCFHVSSEVGSIIVHAYDFPASSHSEAAALWLKKHYPARPRVGFTRYFISLKDYQMLMNHVPDMQIADIASICYRLRSVKTSDELALMSRASKILGQGMAAAIAAVKPGVRETEIIAEAEYAMRLAGSEGSPFRMQAISGQRMLQAHPYAQDRVIEDNGPVVIHLGAAVEGYTSKLCRTVFLNDAPQTFMKAYESLARIQAAAFQVIAPGVTCGQVYSAAYNEYRSQGFGEKWMDTIGYGVGVRQSEFYPILTKGSPTVLEKNMALDILLPTIFGPGSGPRLTDTLYVTADVASYLTDFDRSIICIHR